MGWRKWIVRGVVYGIIGAAVAAGVLYQRWTNPGAVREQVIAEISKTFPGASVSVDSARLRILGGIQLDGLRLSRKDDQEKHEFLHVPSAIFYHDKEKILDGQLKLRKIELFRPRLRVRRGRDGKWNLHDLTRPPAPPEKAQPAMVIHQGTIILEDRIDPDKPTTLEINDVSLTLINDPITHVTIRGGGASELLGKLQLHGSLERGTGEAYLAFKAQQLPLTQNLAGRLPLRCPPDLFTGLVLSAMVNIDGKVSYHPNQPQPFYYDVHCDVHDGKLQHPKLPLAIEKLEVKFNCKNGELLLDKLTARSGATEISASGVAQLPCVDQSFEGQVELKHVMLGQDFADRLTLPKLRNLHDLFQPRGPITIKLDCARHEGQYVSLANGKPSRVTLQPEQIDLCFRGFPYLLERTTGAIDYNLLNHRVDVDLTGYASGRPVFLNGNWTGEKDDADVKFDIRANHVPINERLLQALPVKPVNLQNLAESFHANGLIDVKAHIRHEPGVKEWSNEFHIHVHKAGICWDQFSYSLKEVSGNIDIYPKHWEFHEFQGTNRDGHVVLNGRSWPTLDAKGEKSFGISLEIIGRGVPLDNQLRDALVKMPGLYKAWETFKPQGNLYFTAEVKRPSADINDLDVKVDARGASVKPMFMPYLVEDISGQFNFHKYKLGINKLRAKHGETIIAMDAGYVDLDQRGGYYADLSDVQLRAFRIDDAFIKALPPGKLPTAFTALHMHGPDGQPCPVRVATRLVIAQAPETGKSPDIFWDGKAWMGAANLSAGFEFKNVTGEIACVGRWNGQILGVDGNLLVEQASLFDQPFKKVHAKFAMRDTSPDVLLMGLRAPVFGGDVVGQIRVDLNSALRYEMNLTASQINLAEFGRHNLGPKSQISGIANARLYLHGFGTGMDTLDGHGSIDVPRGHFYNLPFLLDLLKFLGLHWPDRTAFEEFHTTFNVQGPKVNVQKVDLLGSAISLSGKGEFDLTSKNLKLDVFPMWGRIEQLVPQQVRPLPATISKNLITVEVRGPVTGNPKDIKYHMKPLPMIVDPLLLVRDRVLGTENGKMPELRVPGIDLSLPRFGDYRYRIWE